MGFIAGNRDFLLGDAFCRLAGMQRLEEPEIVDLYGVPTVLLHGDVLCTADRDYQAFRRRTRDPSWQRRMLARPVWFRRTIAALMRTVSRWRGRRAPDEIMDVTGQAVRELFRETGVRRMVHGHTHRPARHAVDLGEVSAERIVLGDWYDQGSVLRIDHGGADLRSMSRDRTPG